MKNSKINIGYTRVSTEVQAKEGFSLNYQRNKIIEYFKSNNIENYRIIEDDGKSGTNLNRQLNDVMEMIKKNKVESFTFISIDRLVRNSVILDQLIKLFDKFKVKINCIENSWDTSTPENALVLKIQGLLAEVESEKISFRSKKGLEGKAQLGKYPYRLAPYGYIKTEEHYLVQIPNEIKIVKNIYEYYNKGNSIEVIKNILENEFNLDFSKRKIENILNNTIYQGYIVTNDNKYNITDFICEISNNRKKIAATRSSTKNYYQFKGMVYYVNGIYEYQMRHSTVKKKIKDIKYYYLSSKKNDFIDTSIYINESYIEEEIRFSYSDLTNNEKRIRLKELEIMYARNEITVSEYTRLRNLVWDTEIDVKKIKKIKIDKNKKIEVILK